MELSAHGQSATGLISRVPLRSSRLALALLAALLPGACAHYTSAPIDATEQAHAFRARSLDDPRLRGFVLANLESADSEAWPPPAWDFDTLTLAALFFHPSLAVARAGVEVADARRLTAGGRPNPSLDIVPQYNTSSTGIPPCILGTIVNFNLETAGKRGHRVAAAQHLAEAARWEVASTAWEVRRRLRAALLELYAAGRRHQLLEQQIEAQRQLVLLLEAELQAGAVSGVQVTRERIALSRRQMELQMAAEQAAVARTRVADAVGLTVKAIAGTTLSFNEFEASPEPLPDDQARLRALLNRADILGGLAAYSATESDLQLEIAKQYPDLQIGPGYELDQGDGKWTLALSIPLPILNQNQGPIAEARARRREAAARFLELQASVIAQVEQATARLVAARGRKAVAAKLVADLTRQESVASSMLRAGEVDRGAILGARLELVSGTLAELDAQIWMQRAIGELEDAMQTRMRLPPGLLQPDTITTTDEESK
jgi:cobalt-zinc-cadmium efflux system outer membrane protein